MPSGLSFDGRNYHVGVTCNRGNTTERKIGQQLTASNQITQLFVTERHAPEFVEHSESVGTWSREDGRTAYAMQLGHDDFFPEGVVYYEAFAGNPEWSAEVLPAAAYDRLKLITISGTADGVVVGGTHGRPVGTPVESRGNSVWRAAAWGFDNDGQHLWTADLTPEGPVGRFAEVTALDKENDETVIFALVSEDLVGRMVSEVGALDIGTGTELWRQTLPSLVNLNERLVVATLDVSEDGDLLLGGNVSRQCDSASCSGLQGWVRWVPTDGAGWATLVPRFRVVSSVAPMLGGYVAVAGTGETPHGDDAFVYLLDSEGLVAQQRQFESVPGQDSAVELVSIDDSHVSLLHLTQRYPAPDPDHETGYERTISISEMELGL